MRKLKEYTAEDIQELDDERLESSVSGIIDCTRVYLKSEADKVIKDLIEKNKRLANKDIIMASEAIKEVYKELRHQKYKRCLTKAEWCEERCARFDLLQEHSGFSWRREIDFYFRWYQRWLELAERFKEAK